MLWRRAVHLPTMNCEKRLDLLVEYSRLSEKLFAASTALAAMDGTNSPDYEELKAAVLQARHDAGLARLIYEKHVAEHGC